MLRYMPMIFLPFRTNDQNAELYMGRANVRDNMFQVVLFIVEIILTLAAIPILLLLPGAFSVLASVASCLLVLAITKPIQGVRIAYSNLDEETVQSAEKYEHERWVFINGIATGYRSLSSGKAMR